MPKRSVLLSWLLSALTVAAWSADGAAPSAAPRPGIGVPHFEFDIPAQPLAAALHSYSALSNRPTLFASDLAVGRTSSAVRGRHSAAEALHALLAGTGLIAEGLGTELGPTFLLKEGSTASGAARQGTATLFSLDGYAGLAQARITQALCADPRTASGHYSGVVRFWLDESGAIQGGRLLGSTGDPARDTVMLQLLGRVRIEQRPPAALVRQALTVLLLPAEPGSKEAPRCVSGSAAKSSPDHG